MRFFFIVKAEKGLLAGLLVFLLLPCGNACSNSFSSAFIVIVVVCKRDGTLPYFSGLHQHQIC